ncbi:MAG: glucose-1-phosphate cytidylyltransferase [Pseudomonadota bacterium]|uniref:glucose-1-phosphate cytidylyltransferase n=1 Tax=Roseovarius TaxID=74030 RepID=UPI0022A72621|nr:glucose-1-phosphate cytidylyltransferase [Roseovarius sp. EGI FJ00037]MCZ0811361.1 glucose-1-phosphate cytidylyltransferase [Roseovarius sp. EGI FJ00037]
MKVVLLAGGFGTRLSEETVLRPKPLVEIGGRPILWHIMKIYAAHGFDEFILCLGYKGHEIKQYFYHNRLDDCDITIDLASRDITYHEDVGDPWKVTMVETGLHSMTGGRLQAVRPYLDPEAPFLMSYGDGVGDVDIRASVAFHQQHGKLATVTAVTPPGRFGVLDIEGQNVRGFREKIAGDQYKINAGFFVLSPRVLDYIDGPDCVWEQDPMRRLAAQGQLMAYEHNGFWQPMDTLRDRNALEELYATGEAPWRIW